LIGLVVSTAARQGFGDQHRRLNVAIFFSHPYSTHSYRPALSVWPEKTNNPNLFRLKKGISHADSVFYTAFTARLSGTEAIALF
jgi:hypothetical protein